MVESNVKTGNIFVFISIIPNKAKINVIISKASISFFIKNLITTIRIKIFIIILTVFILSK